MKHIKLRTQMIHTPMAGLALAIASLGWGWDHVMPVQGFQMGCSLVASALLLMLVAKFLSHPKHLLEDLAHPVVGSVVPTFAMATMVVASTLASRQAGLANALWLFAVVLHLTFLVLFSYHRSRQFKMADMVPSWFVPPVGIIVAALTCPQPQFQPLATGLLYFGLACYAVLLPLMVYRLLCCGSLPTAAKPTFAIMAAPASLALAGYLSIIEQPNPAVLYLLLPLALAMTALLYLAFFSLLRLPFSPGYAAFTFPTVIGATALLKLSDYLQTLPQGQGVSQVLYQIGQVELMIATAVVLYVAGHYLWDQIKHQRGFAARIMSELNQP
ncbi:TDT family transporter [Motilimonas pumila]|uniref:C4-dicarboxylate ABC transporter n=1 Tax=Motilimonas pumila TaxID=2303987 RepID=A0A418YBT0_9GAMM|nr:TDT family transporter [Motilimonas pumila]RJG41934.1 C4-dicarboxylate ABC transporter [Motilimonas pumila]